MRYLQALAIVSLLQGTVLSQSTWIVDVTGVPPGNGTSGSPYTSIQYAVEQPSTVSGDTVLVRPGAYLETIDYLGKDLTLRSSGGPQVTIVTATPPPAAPVPAVFIGLGEGGVSVFEGFTVTGGQPPDGRGGAIFCLMAAAEIHDCVVTANDSYEAAVWIESSTVDVRECAFVSNDGPALRFVDSPCGVVLDSRFEENRQLSSATAGIWVTSSNIGVERCDFISNESNVGAAIFAEMASQLGVTDCRFDSNLGAPTIHVRSGSVTVRGSEFSDNRAFFDGGAAAYVEDCSAFFQDCSFVRNRAGVDDYRGGAIWGSNADLTVLDSIFLDNLSARGGAAYTDGGSALYRRCWFEGNRAVQQTCCLGGGGGAIGKSPGGSGSAENCVFLRNRADGTNVDPGVSEGFGGAVLGSFQLSLCTLVDNFAQDGGGGAYDATLVSCIAVGNEPDQLAGGATASFSNIEGGSPGGGNIDAAPLFLDAQNDNFYLAPGSPCIDAGAPASPPDLDGSRADMGAFQFVDCNGNGVLDADDISAGASLDLNGNGFPDECECLATPYCETSPHSVGAGASMGFGGSTSVSENDLVLVANGCPPNRPGLFFYGTERGSTPFGDGRRCVLGRTFRLGLGHSNPQGVAVHALDILNPPQPSGQITTGSRWYFQFWFRDPNGPGGTGFNLSDGLDVIFCP